MDIHVVLFIIATTNSNSQKCARKTLLPRHGEVGLPRTTQL